MGSVFTSNLYPCTVANYARVLSQAHSDTWYMVIAKRPSHVGVDVSATLGVGN